ETDLRSKPRAGPEDALDAARKGDQVRCGEGIALCGGAGLSRFLDAGVKQAREHARIGRDTHNHRLLAATDYNFCVGERVGPDSGGCKDLLRNDRLAVKGL